MRTPLLAIGALLIAGSTLALPAADSGAATKTKAPTYYVSLGDSYAVGYQPSKGSTNGYTVPVAKATHLTLVNFGCGGATTSSILNDVGCPDVLPHTTGGQTYPTTTQIAAADAFITAHQGHIGLITVSIGGNDVTSCASQANPIACVGTAVQSITTNVTTLAGDLRTAAGTGVPIIGSTYPDVILGSYVYPTHPASPATITLAKESVVAFKSLINPALKKAYVSAQGSLVDVTSATGAYGPLTKTVKTKRYGRIPVPVQKVCSLTWFCSKGDIHSKTPGYNIIGKLIVSKYNAVKK
jgi:lysophospholipase L1-like esterase